MNGMETKSRVMVVFRRISGDRRTVLSVGFVDVCSLHHGVST